MSRTRTYIFRVGAVGFNRRGLKWSFTSFIRAATVGDAETTFRSMPRFQRVARLNNVRPESVALASSGRMNATEVGRVTQGLIGGEYLS